MKPFVPCSDQEYFHRLVTEAPYIEGWHSNSETFEDITWLDRDLLQRSSAFFHKHRLSLAASTGINALFGIPFKNITLPFMQTGTISSSAEKTVKRTVKHVTHFVEWFTEGAGDLKTYNDIQKIKKMHIYLSKNIKPYRPPVDETVPNQKVHQEFLDAAKADYGEMCLENAFGSISRYDPKIYFSQFDMVIIQLDLIGAFFQPEKHGIEDEGGLEGFLHHWAVVGRLLGIHDRFNLALHPSVDLCNRILQNLMALIPAMDLTLSTLFEAHLTGISLYFHFPASPPAVLYAFSSVALPGFKGAHLMKLMSWFDKLAVTIFLGTFRLMHASNAAKTLVRNAGVRICALTSSRYHKLSREDKLKLPAELII
jgi:hypothetical protein